MFKYFILNFIFIVITIKIKLTYLIINETNISSYQVWLSYAQFEANTNNEESKDRTRSIYKKAYAELKQASSNESRLMILEAWKDFEDDEGQIKHVESLMPKQIRKRRKIQAEDGVSDTTLLHFSCFNPDISTLKNLGIRFRYWV